MRKQTHFFFGVAGITTYLEGIFPVQLSLLGIAAVIRENAQRSVGGLWRRIDPCDLWRQRLANAWVIRLHQRFSRLQLQFSGAETKRIWQKRKTITLGGPCHPTEVALRNHLIVLDVDSMEEIGFIVPLLSSSCPLSCPSGLLQSRWFPPVWDHVLHEEVSFCQAVSYLR